MLQVVAILHNRKLRFAISSLIATACDHILFVVLIQFGTAAAVSNFISQGFGMVINFVLQKQFIFQLKRNAWLAFLLSLVFSLIGLLLGSFIVHFMTSLPAIDQMPYVGKLIATGIVFFYNYFTKRFAFERR